MKVYRYLNEDELNNIIDGNMIAVGNYFQRVGTNTHKYHGGEKHLHFFRKKENCEYIKEIKRGSDKKWFVAEFNIPLLQLLKGVGVGYYDAHTSGYDADYYNKLLEFAIKVSDFNPDWLVSFQRDKDTPFIENVEKE